MIDCIDEDFIYEEYEDMVEAAELAAGENIARVETKTQDDRGPCPGKGDHYDFYNRRGRFIGSGFSCTCCEDTLEGPKVKTKYKYNG
jgi:hypothetical protein